MSEYDNITLHQQSSILKQISDSGRKVKVRCADNELLEKNWVFRDNLGDFENCGNQTF